MTVKVKTENDLEERFQWNTSLNPDHIFEDELEMIKELRKVIPELELEDDKFVAVFLFARRHSIQRKQEEDELEGGRKKKRERRERVETLLHLTMNRFRRNSGAAQEVLQEEG